MLEALLRVTGVTAGYGRIEALHGVDLVVNTSETVCLIGRNGAGKSTLLKTIAGLLRPSAGQILLDGEEITGWPIQRRARSGIALVPEGRRVFEPLSVHDNLLLGGHGQQRQLLAASLDDVYTRFPHLAERRNQIAGTLSGGEQQMLAIGRALMSGPSVILLDEPSLGLAPRAVDEVVHIISAMAGGSAGILVVEQNPQVAFRIAGRGYLLERGAVTTSGPSGSLRVDARVRAAYLGNGL